MKEALHHTISQKVPEIFDLYTELHGARVSLFSPDGALLYPHAPNRPDCRYCSLLRKKLGLDPLCRSHDVKMMRAALQQREMISYTCHAGMREACGPIIVDHKLVAFVMIGQIRSEAAPKRSPYAARWKEQHGTNAIQQEFDKTVIFPEDKIETLFAMLRQLLELIISSHLIQHKDYDLIAPVIKHIREHPESSLTLEDASRMAGRSQSTVTRLFKKITGRGFKQYQIDYRLQQAGSLLQTHPNRPIQEIAEAVGFADPLYFSRLFSKHMGHSPREHRKLPTSFL